MKFFTIAIVFSLLCTHASAQEKGADSMLNFLQYNKGKSSAYFMKNGKTISKLNENWMIPLASTVKIMIAVEFAKQAAAEVFSEEKYIALSEIDKYYLPYNDSIPQQRWRAFLNTKGLIKDDSVQLIDVARGMMNFNCNANSEYLFDILGFDNIKNNIQLLGLKKHTAIFPLVSSLFMFQNPKHVKEEKLIKELRSLTEEQYCKYIFKVHTQLKWDTGYKKRFNSDDLTPAMQKLWNDRLPVSTVQDYARLCQVLNNRIYFDDNTYGILAEVMEGQLETSPIGKLISHAGFKDGSTLFVVTNAIYGTLKDKSKYELALFFNNLEPQESARIKNWIPDFNARLLSDEPFRRRLQAVLL